MIAPIVILQVLTGLGFIGHAIPQFSHKKNRKKLVVPKNTLLSIIIGAAALLIVGVSVRLMALVLLVITLISLAERVRDKQHFVGGWENSYLYAVCALVILIGGRGWMGW